MFVRCKNRNPILNSLHMLYICMDSLCVIIPKMAGWWERVNEKVATDTEIISRYTEIKCGKNN